MAHGAIRIGTSGWNYDHWIGPFYPDGLPKKQWLHFYADRFHSVEVNNSFYQLPTEKTLQAWKEVVPRGFRFAVKCNRYVTHMKKLKDPAESMAKFFDRVDVLGAYLGPVLFQLPPNWRFDAARLEAFLDALPGGHRYVFEFRDPDWWNDRTYELLREAGAAFCQFDLAGEQSPREITADFVYVRLHGPGEAYEGSYGEQSLRGWVGAFSAWAARGRDVYCYFDNDQNGYAARNAARLHEMLG
jgi:uncharacterized protein YecE (DUF72 family)